jgi:hypothetical protein
MQIEKPEVRKEEKLNEDLLDDIFKVMRDPEVSDAVWEQLERDKHALVARERDYKQRQAEKREEEQRIKGLVRAETAAAEGERRVLEQRRIEAELERRRKDEELAAIEEQRAREKAAQKKIREMGPCPAGFRWIKGSGGYRCAGGSHWMSDTQLGL